MPPRSLSLAAVTLLAAAVALVGCGTPPDLPTTPTGPLPMPTTSATPTATPGPVPTSAPAPPGDGDRAVDCAGEPDGDAVVAVLRAAQLLGDEKVTVVVGPLCAEDWQYTVVAVPDRDPLQVVTTGAPGRLELVTAGTDVCSIEVRVRAPSGIRAAASCVG